MKALLASLMLIGVQAVACPNLTGTFACSFEGQTELVQLSQQVVNGSTVYTIRDPNDPNNTGDMLPADNNVYNLPDSEDFRNSTFRGWCEGDSYKMLQAGHYYQEGQHLANLEILGTLSIVDNNLHQEVEGTIEMADGSKTPFQEVTTCLRQ